MIISCISHKGGTGRTVSLVNIGYRLAEGGNSVCLVDLDLGSPTLLSALGLDHDAAGVSGETPGVHRYLSGQAVFSRDDVIDLKREFGLQTDFHVVPGTMFVGDKDFTRNSIREPLGRLVSTLDKHYDYVLCDLRSGISNVLHALASLPDAGGPQSGWLLFYRSTPQHIEGLANMIDLLGSELEGHQSTLPTIGLVRTASLDPASYPEGEIRKFARARTTELHREELSIVQRKPFPLEMGGIPFEPVLQWREGVLTERRPSHGVVDPKTIEAYRALANRVKETFR